jgi:hypothetical protein
MRVRHPSRALGSRSGSGVTQRDENRCGRSTRSTVSISNHRSHRLDKAQPMVARIRGATVSLSRPL